MPRILFVTQAHPGFSRLSVIADIVMAGLILGPLAAPYLSASALPPLSIIADIVYGMGLHVCPQPQMGPVLASPFAMAVCMRCYGTVLGLTATRLLYTARGAAGPYWLKQYGWQGALLTVLLLLAYPAELAGQIFDLWSFNNYIMTCFGMVTGTALGLFIVPMLYGPAHKLGL